MKENIFKRIQFCVGYKLVKIIASPTVPLEKKAFSGVKLKPKCPLVDLGPHQTRSKPLFGGAEKRQRGGNTNGQKKDEYRRARR